MFDRLLRPPARSFFLFGPRATGKSTWLARSLPDALVLDLLRSDTYFTLSSRPQALREIVAAGPRSRWIVIDEVQRIPSLLDEVHALIEEGHKFALTGSSARVLERGKANLLAGRAVVRNFFPLVHPEHEGRFGIEELLRYGALPVVLDDPDARVDVLEAYAGTYLREEIKEEALTRNVQAFSRFLAVAALANGQVTNLSNIARDSGVPRATITTYFEILVDTLIGRFLPAWAARARVKERAHPKFYFFDTGVARAVQGRLHNRPTADERGHLLETHLFHELSAYLSYRGTGGELAYWRTTSGVEVDFVWRRGPHTVAIECKAADRWRTKDDAGLLALGEHRSIRAFGAYLGRHRLKRPWGVVFPVTELLDALWTGKVTPAGAR